MNTSMSSEQVKCSQESWEQLKKGILTDELKNLLGLIIPLHKHTRG